MEKKTLAVIAESESFVVGAVISQLQKNEVEAKYYSVEDVSEHGFEEDYLLVFSECFINKNLRAATCLKNLSQYCAFKVILIGTESENEKMREYFPPAKIAYELKKPMDVRAICEKIFSILYEENNPYEDKKVILAVDDSGMMLRTIAGWLDNEFTLRLANSAAKAMTMLTFPRPDLILLDYDMPVCSGAQFLEMIRAEENSKDIPVVFFTYRDDAKTVSDVLSLKPDGYLLKSCTKKQLMDKIHEVMK